MNSDFPASRRRAIFLIAAAGYVLSHFYRTFLTILVDDLARDLGIGPAEFGLLGGLWFLAFAFSQFPIGVALDRFGPRRTIGLTMFVGVIGVFLFAAAQSPLPAMLAMVLSGIGCSPILMGTLYFLARVESPSRFAGLGSLFFSLGLIGSLLSAAPLALLVQWLGWRMAIALSGAVMAAIAALILAIFRDPPAEPARAGGALIGDVVALVRLSGFWPILVMALAITAPIAAERALWIAPYFAEIHGLDLVARGNAVLLLAIATSLSALIAGPLAASPLGPKPVVLAGNLLSGAGFLALAFWPEPPLAAALAACAAMGLFSGTYAVLIAHARQFMPAHVIGRGITFINFLAIGSAGLVQAASGLRVEALKAGALPAPALYADLHLAFGAMLIGCALIYVLAPARPRV